MVMRMLRAGFFLFLSTTWLLGCAVELRSPIKISKPKETEETSPPPRVVYAPPPAEPASPGRGPVSPYPQQPPIITRQPAAEPQLMPPSAEQLPATSTLSPEQIVILSPEYLANTQYISLGKVSVKDVSENGFSKQEAKDGLKYEAFRQYGGQAKGITNVTYEGETSFFGSERYYAASGDVITWEEGSTTPTSDAVIPPRSQERTYDVGTGGWAKAPALDVAPLETEGAAPDQQLGQEPYLTAQEGLASPENILILSKEDLTGYDFWVLGKISVHSESKDGFDEDGAHQALKTEAFKQHGANARAIINITCKKKRSLLKIWSTKYKEASGDVVTWRESKKGTPLKLQSLSPQVSPAQTSTAPIPVLEPETSTEETEGSLPD